TIHRQAWAETPDSPFVSRCLSKIHPRRSIMGEPSVWVLFFLGLILGAMAMGLLGAALVLGGFKIAGVPSIPFWKCWRYYSASIGYGIVVLWLLSCAGRFRDQPALTESIIVWVAVAALTQIVVLPLLLRQFTVKALAVQIVAVL